MVKKTDEKNQNKKSVKAINLLSIHSFDNLWCDLLLVQSPQHAISAVCPLLQVYHEHLHTHRTINTCHHPTLASRWRHSAKRVTNSGHLFSVHLHKAPSLLTSSKPSLSGFLVGGGMYLEGITGGCRTMQWEGKMNAERGQQSGTEMHAGRTEVTRKRWEQDCTYGSHRGVRCVATHHWPPARNARNYQPRPSGNCEPATGPGSNRRSPGYRQTFVHLQKQKWERISHKLTHCQQHKNGASVGELQFINK